MDQLKTGRFLKELRNGRNLTQEEVANHFNVATRTVSRWETGYNLPDLSLLVDIADFYDVDLRDIIDGETKENMDTELKDTLKKAAEYTEKMQYQATANGVIAMSFSALLLNIICVIKGYPTEPMLIILNAYNGVSFFTLGKYKDNKLHIISGTLSIIAMIALMIVFIIKR